MKRTILAAALAMAFGMMGAEAHVPPGKRINVVVPFKVTLGGLFKFEAVKADGTRRLLSDWQPNLILNAGLNRMGTGDFITYCQVGTGNTAPANSDTGLVARVAGTSTLQASSQGTNGGAPYYGYQQRTFRFAQGDAAGNLAEVGIGWGNTGATLFSRALIKDSGGTPTTIVVQADEFLDVSYELRMYAPAADAVSSPIAISGTDYTFTVRASNVTSTSYWVPANQLVGLNAVGVFPGYAFNGAIAAVTAAPSGVQGASTSFTPQTYSNNSLQRDMIAYWDLNAGNLSGGITAFLFATSIGAFQVGVSPAMTKSATKLLNLTTRVSWARH